MKTQSWNEFWSNYKEPSDAEKWLIYERDILIKKLLKEKWGKKKVRILEIGCGYASNSRLLNLEKNIEVFCLDSSKKVVSIIKKEIKNSYVGDARKLPFKDKYFDLVFSSGLIEHFKDPSPLTNEMVRVVKPRGIILTFVPGRYSLWRAWVKFNQARSKWQHGYEESYTYGKLKKAFASLKTITVKCGGLDPFSLNGLALKLFKRRLMPISKSLPSAYTEVYLIVERK